MWNDSVCLRCCISSVHYLLASALVILGRSSLDGGILHVSLSLSIFYKGAHTGLVLSWFDFLSNTFLVLGGKVDLAAAVVSV